MKCIDCNCCRKGWFDFAPDVYVCIGVKEPFAINNINRECTEYPEKRHTATMSIIIVSIFPQVVLTQEMSTGFTSTLLWIITATIFVLKILSL